LYPWSKHLYISHDLDARGLRRRHTKRGVEGRLRVLLDAEDRELESRLELGVGHIGHLHPQSHGSNESLQLDRFTCKALANERSLVDHSLP